MADDLGEPRPRVVHGILEIHADKPYQSHKSGQARDGGGWIERPGGLGRATWLAATVAGPLMSFFRRNSIAIAAAVLGFIFARAVKRASARRSADHAEIRLSPLASRLSATGRTIAQPPQFGQCGPVRLPIQRLLGLDDVVQAGNQDRQAERLPRVRPGGQLVE